jgi:homoserine O-acetyltransferase
MSHHLTQTLGPFRFRRGGELPGITLAYETWGELSPARDNALLLTTGLTPGSHARSTPANPSPGWWDAMIGPGMAIDTDRYFVICNNSLGSCHGSTGPASVNPATGAPWRLTFPELTVEDIAASSRLLLQSLGIDRLSAVVGSSLGGMTALAYGLLFPGEVDQIVTISSAAHAGAFAIALRSLQREAIRSDPDWQNGNYPAAQPPHRGLGLARKLGMITYRAASEWAPKFGRERTATRPSEPFGVEFEVESYLQYHADRFVPIYDANSYLYISRAMDLFDAAEHGDSLIHALKKIRARRFLVVGAETDLLFPIHQQAELAEALIESGHNVQFARLPSEEGHDSFLTDLARFSPAVGDFLKQPL